MDDDREDVNDDHDDSDEEEEEAMKDIMMVMVTRTLITTVMTVMTVTRKGRRRRQGRVTPRGAASQHHCCDIFQDGHGWCGQVLLVFSITCNTDIVSHRGKAYRTSLFI